MPVGGRIIAKSASGKNSAFSRVNFYINNMIFREGHQGSPQDVLSVPKSKECFIPAEKVAQMAQILQVTENELIDAINEFLPVRRRKTKKEDGVKYDFVYFRELSEEEILQSNGVRLSPGRKGVEMRLLVKSTEKPHTRTASDFFVFAKDFAGQDTDKTESKKILISEKGHLSELKDLGVGPEPYVDDPTPPYFKDVILPKVRRQEREWLKKHGKFGGGYIAFFLIF